MTAKNILITAVLMASSFAIGEEAERKLITPIDPELPQLAQKMDIHGTVKLKIWVNPDGSVRRLEYIGGHPVLAEAALNAVKKWKYVPNDKETTEVVALKF